MKKLTTLISILTGTTLISFLPFLPVKATEVRLHIFPILTAHEANCPEFIIINQESDPYYEGGYTMRGNAELKNIAGDFFIASQDLFSTTWTAVLNPQYANCNATGRITEIEGESYDYHSYLTVRFIAGQIILKADFTGLNDANNYTPVLQESGVNDGSPFWVWGGTD